MSNLGKPSHQIEREQQAQLDRIELKLDQVLDFHAALATAIEPFLSGKNVKWLALVAKAKSRGGGG